MPRNRGQRRKAAIYRNRYDNRASEVQVRYPDGTETTKGPCDRSQLGRTVARGNAVADPRPRSERRTWSSPGD